MTTRKNLHSHHFQSPLSNNYEVSCFGENGEGDEGDNWKVVCDDTFWERDDKVRFQHGATSGYVTSYILLWFTFAQSDTSGCGAQTAVSDIISTFKSPICM